MKKLNRLGLLRARLQRKPVASFDFGNGSKVFYLLDDWLSCSRETPAIATERLMTDAGATIQEVQSLMQGLIKELEEVDAHV